MAILLIFALICSVSYESVTAYPTGAPEATCISMFPKHHGAEQQQTDCPFSLTPANSTYGTANVTLTVTNSGGRQFKGIEIRARRTSGDTEEDLGTFFPSDDGYLRTVDCLGGTANMVTHKTKAKKTGLTVMWQPPASSAGDVLFTVTYVENFTNFWTDVRSTALTNNSPNPDRGSLKQTANVDPQVDFGGACGDTKGCFTIPSECMGNNCDVAVSYKTVENTVEFEMFGKAEGWVSVGFSEDRKMGMDETVTCTAQGSRLTVQRGFNPQKYNERQYTAGITNMRTMQRDGKIYCGFTRPMVTRVRSVSYDTAGVTPIDRTYDLSKDFYMLLGWGPTYQDTDVVGKHIETPGITQTKVNFKTYVTYKGIEGKTGNGPTIKGSIQTTVLALVVSFIICRAYRK